MPSTMIVPVRSLMSSIASALYSLKYSRTKSRLFWVILKPPAISCALPLIAKILFRSFVRLQAEDSLRESKKKRCLASSVWCFHELTPTISGVKGCQNVASLPSLAYITLAISRKPSLRRSCTIAPTEFFTYRITSSHPIRVPVSMTSSAS